MVQYNLYFANALVGNPSVLLRAQEKELQAASYVAPNELRPRTHASMGHRLYGHFTSPIRRFADLHNQFVIKGTLPSSLSPDELCALNKRMAELQLFHYKDTVAGLAYRFKSKPEIIDARVEATEDGTAIYIFLPERRVCIPLKANYFAEPIAARLQEVSGMRRVEVFGIIKNHRAQLRLRLDPVSDHALRCIDRKAWTPSEGPKENTITFDAAVDRMQGLVGYELDAFQRKALRVILDGDDLIGMAPTGSGKTILALLAIVLRAFDVGGRAVLTSPIKALSNQKYSEFTTWLGKRVTLLTGDIQVRAAPPGGDREPELLIMTSEILANKLDAMHSSGVQDPDLRGVSVVVMDEVHYINDPERGSVWERSLMMMPQNIQIVALSATLHQPGKFCEWMSRRRPTHVVQRHDRHVPLHFGGYSNKGHFVQLFGTHSENKSLSAAAYEDVYLGEKLANGRRPDRPHANMNQGVNQLVQLLERDDKLPAIVFFMSRDRCVAAASAITRNMLLGHKLKKEKDQDDYEFQWLEEQHAERVKEIRNRQDQLFRKHLVQYKAVLEATPGFSDFKEMLDRGVGYHHAGMIPLLREYVELLFQNRLLKIVFATETLGVGINMPARTVVFTQLDKPCGGADSRTLRTDEFWQMAGRSGRRGMDAKGYVIYHPMGTKPIAPVHEVRSLLTGTMPSAKSQLQITPHFVLRQQLSQDVLSKTLLSHEHLQRSAAMWHRIKDMPEHPKDVIDDVLDYMAQQRRLKQTDGFIKLTPKQRKACETQMEKIRRKYDGFDTIASQVQERLAIATDAVALDSGIRNDWNESCEWLVRKGYLTEDGSMTMRGKASAGLSDGLPLVRGAVLCEGLLDDASFEAFAAWLSIFADPLKVGAPPSGRAGKLPAFVRWQELADECGAEVNVGSAAVVQAWMASKDIRDVAAYVEHFQLGVFIKVILRVVSFIDEIKPVILGLEKYELYNRLEGHHDRLLAGIVTNKSLYT